MLFYEFRISHRVHERRHQTEIVQQLEVRYIDKSTMMLEQRFNRYKDVIIIVFYLPEMLLSENTFMIF